MDSWDHLSSKLTNGLASYDVRAILQDRTGTCWVGTFGGLNVWSNQQFTSITTRQGLSDDRVQTLYEDSESTLWIGTQKGLNRLRKGVVRALTSQDGLFHDVVNQILEDDSGNFWMSCPAGIYQVNRQHLNDVADGRTNRIRCVAYGESDGMVSSETAGGSQPAGCKARDGRLWFPTAKGVVVFDPQSLPENRIPPPVVIEQVIVDDEVVHGDRSSRPKEAPISQLAPHEVSAPSPRLLRLGPGRARYVEFRYTANSFTAPENVRFKYRLEGHDQDWRDAGAERSARYNNLRPGNYTFRVKASNNHGYWNEVGDSFAFSLAPHFYQTAWFSIACALAVIGVGFGIHPVRVGVIREFERLRQQHALELERARIAQDMHDELGANLTNIALLGEVVKQNLSRTELIQTEAEKISNIAGGLVDNLSELVWAANPKHDTLPELVSYLREKIGSFFEGDAIRCRMDFPANPPDLPVAGNVRRNLYLAVKEALHNVLKHSRATEVCVRLRCVSDDTSRETHSPSKPTTLEIQITDNGRGFDANGNNNGLHHGLENMKRRLADLNGTFNLQSGPGQGTNICMRITL
ncbi:MAG: hypothetical protein HY735_30460 [Verrucomicrobia bacterium]|nr:hypothetical protein [Verrucomicrobiota bacterium]